jgi:hypothetical protein
MTFSAGRANTLLVSLLVVVVSVAWIAILFLPVAVTVQTGVQAAMMVVLGAFFGGKLFGKDKNGDSKP